MRGISIGAVVLPLMAVAACGGSGSADAEGTTAADTTGVGTTGSSSTGGSTGTESGGDTTDAATSTGGAMACNGAAALCDRPLDQVTIPTTHNSAAAMEHGFAAINANQTHGLRRQLDDGIRGFMLDVTEDGGDTWLCHGPCALGKLAHAEALTILGDFLAEQPNEVIVIIYEDSAPVDAIVADWDEAGLVDRTVVLDGTTWPTLGELIAADTRIVVTAENGAPPPAWFHHAWSVVWDTPYSFHSLREMSCDENRGEPGVGLFLVNHWLSTDLDLPDEARAAEANAYDVLLARAQGCGDAWGHPVNLLGVDFYEQGDLLGVAAALNAR